MEFVTNVPRWLKDCQWILPSHIAVHVALLVDSQVVRGAHIVGSMDGLGTKAQVANGHAAALLGIVLEVGLEVPKWMQFQASTKVCPPLQAAN